MTEKINHKISHKKINDIKYQSQILSQTQNLKKKKSHFSPKI